MLAYAVVWLFLGFLSGTVALGAPAHPVRSVRFGTHGTLSRMVIDLHGNTAYTVGGMADPSTIRIEFPGMTALPDTAVWRSQTPLIREVAFVTEAGKVMAEIRLIQPGSVQAHAILKAPSRIVIDIAPRTAEPPLPTAMALPAQAPAQGASSQVAADRMASSTSGVSQTPASAAVSATPPGQKKRPEAPKKQPAGASTADMVPAAEPQVSAGGPPAASLADTAPPTVSAKADLPRVPETTALLPVNVPSSALQVPQEAPKGSPQVAGAKVSEAAPSPAQPARVEPARPQPSGSTPGVAPALESLKIPGARLPGVALSSADLLGLAEHQWKQGQLDKAYQSYKVFLEQFPTYANNHFIAVRLADILRAKRDYRAALDAYARVFETYPGTEGAFVSLMQMAELGVSTPELLPDRGFPRYFPYHHPFAALQTFMQTYPLSPLAPVAQFKIGSLHLHRQEWPAALGVFQQLLEQPLKPELRQEVQGKARETLQGIMDGYRQGGRDLSLLQAYFTHKALLAPEAAAHPDFLFPVAMSYARLGLLPEAQSLLQTLLPLADTPEQRVAYSLELLPIFLRRGLLQEARELFRTVEAATPPESRGGFLLALSKLARQSGQSDATVQYARQGESLVGTPGERASLLALLGAGYLAQGKPQESLRAFQQCAEVATGTGQAPLPEAETCLLQLARVQGAERQFQPALATYATLLQGFPQTSHRAQVLLHIADMAQENGDVAQVQKAFTALRDTGASVLWQKLGADALEDVAWRQKFHERLAELQNQPSR